MTGVSVTWSGTMDCCMMASAPALSCPTAATRAGGPLPKVPPASSLLAESMGPAQQRAPPHGSRRFSSGALGGTHVLGRTHISYGGSAGECQMWCRTLLFKLSAKVYCSHSSVRGYPGQAGKLWSAAESLPHGNQGKAHDGSPVTMSWMMPMLGRMSATCRLDLEVPELAGMMCCVSVRYRRDTCMGANGLPHLSCEIIYITCCHTGTLLTISNVAPAEMIASLLARAVLCRSA